MTDQEENKKTNDTKIGIHSVRNFLGSPGQLELFSDHPAKFESEYGVKVDKQIEQFGVDLTDIQMRVMEGILRGFSETNYKGNIASEKKEEIAQERYLGKLPPTFKYIRELPRLRVTQKQVVEWAGLNTGSAADKQRATDALKFLGVQQFCLYYNRLAYDQSGRPERDKKGNWKKEDVDAVDTLFVIKTVREEVDIKSPLKGSKIRGDVKYYEITPSAIFLDQIETYFILMPYNWRDEIDALYQKKKFSAFIPKFIYFLRLQYELRRRSKNEKPYQIKWSPEEIAIALKMPKTVYKRNKERMNSILEEAYTVAKRLGYLQSVERTPAVDILTFQDTKFVISNTPTLEKAIGAMSSHISPAQSYLFEFFHNKKKELNVYHTVPAGQEREEQLRDFHLLLSEKKPTDIEELIKWGLSQKYWCERLSTPAKLRAHFDSAWTEMNVIKKQQAPASGMVDNEKIAKALMQFMQANRPDIEIIPSRTYMEIRSKDSVHVITLDYTAKDYRLKIETFLQKINIPLAALEPYFKALTNASEFAESR